MTIIMSNNMATTYLGGRCAVLVAVTIILSNNIAIT